jgi:ribonuclease HI
LGDQNCIIKTDSKVIAAQIENKCITGDATLEKYLALIRRMQNYFKGFSVEHIQRNNNIEADELAKAAVQKMVSIIAGEDW